MAWVTTIKVHRQGGKLRQVGDEYSTEDKLVLESGFVRLLGGTGERPGYQTAAMVPEVEQPVAKEPDPVASEPPPEAEEEPAAKESGKRKYKRRDMSAES